jgi:hypothetical protein
MEFYESPGSLDGLRVCFERSRRPLGERVSRVLFHRYHGAQSVVKRKIILGGNCLNRGGRGGRSGCIGRGKSLRLVIRETTSPKQAPHAAHAYHAGVGEIGSTLDLVWTLFGPSFEGSRESKACNSLRNLVGPARFELATSCTPSKRASQAAPRPDRRRLPHHNMEAGAVHCSYNGIFPCFFRGMVSVLFSSIRSAVISLGRVKRGSMTSST